MNYPKISIVTPSYNQGNYIEQTILSVLDQNYPNLEYVIIDGGSSDNTVDVIKKYENRISYWISEPDKGQTDAINKGFKKCTGDIFNWINSDDYYEPETFYKLARLFANHPSVNVVCGKEWGFNDDTPSDRISHPGSFIGKNVFETIRTGIIDQPCTFFRKKKIDFFFPLSAGLRYVMDRQLWWCYLLEYGQGDILKVDEVFTHFRLHPGSKSIGESDLFDKEFDRLKISLFQRLNAPQLLKEQIPECYDTLEVNWLIKVKPETSILAEFAFFYAVRNYIKGNIGVTSQLMELVKGYKGWQMNKREMRLWVLCCLLPEWFLMRLKKIKQAN